MGVSASSQASYTNGSEIPNWTWAYKAAICPQQEELESSKLQKNLSEMKENLSRVTGSGQNTLLHLASAAGNFNFIKGVLDLNQKPDFLETKNVNGNTALHEAAQGGHSEVVELLLEHGSVVNVSNNLQQTPLFKACEGGHTKVVKKLLKKLEADPSKLLDKSDDGRTCLHAVVNGGHADTLKELLTYIDDNLGHKREHLLKQTDRQGNTLLHLATRRNHSDIVKRLVEFERDLFEHELSYALNLDKDTAICVAVKLGFLSVVEALVNCSPDSIEIASKNGKNILHLAVELGHAKILEFLVEKVGVSQLINQADESGGDTPLHIAAKTKNAHMVDLLLKVRGVNKEAVNSAGLTPLDIARNNTEYHEPYKIIEKLSTYPQKCRPFLYSAPTMSPEKQKKAMEIMDKFFTERSTAELVVAVLLATMAFTAVFTVPGGFHTDPTTEDKDMLGEPVLVGYDSFKLFLIFDCLAFFLSLFVVLMWEMSTPLTTTDKMLFTFLTGTSVCAAFAFTAFGLMAALYLVLAHKIRKFALIVLGSSMFIAVCGTGAFFYIAMKFMLRRARFHRLCGVPRLVDDAVERVWVNAEISGFVDFARRWDEFLHGLVSGNVIYVSGNVRRVRDCGCGKESPGCPSSCPPSLDP